jgi:hypothetical protein
MLQGEIVGPFALVKDALWKFIFHILNLLQKYPLLPKSHGQGVKSFFKKGDKLINKLL